MECYYMYFSALGDNKCNAAIKLVFYNRKITNIFQALYLPSWDLRK